MKLLRLYNGNYAMVDDEDYDECFFYTWGEVSTKKSCTSYAKTKINGKFIFLHRFIFNIMRLVGEIDHIDGNGLNNQRSNLRVVTHSQSMYNRRKFKNNTSGFKGVSYDKKRKMFRARINVDKKYIHLGYFNTVEQAFEVYKIASIKYHGEFGRWD